MSAIPASITEELKPKRRPFNAEFYENSAGVRVVCKARKSNEWLPQELEINKSEYLDLETCSSALIGGDAIIAVVQEMRHGGGKYHARFDFYTIIQ